MQKEKVAFRYSDSDLSTYLMILGYIPIHIDIVIDKKHNGRLKGYVYFEGCKDDLIMIQNKFNNDEIKVNPREFSLMRKKLNKLINIEIEKFRLNQ